jgi:hypothetical protein
VQRVGDHCDLSDEQKDGAGIRDREVDGPVKRGIKYFGGSLDSAWTRSRNARVTRATLAMSSVHAVLYSTRILSNTWTDRG